MYASTKEITKELKAPLAMTLFLRADYNNLMKTHRLIPLNRGRRQRQACGICHSDSLMKEGLFPGIQYPRVPGHQIAGVIDAVGKDVIEWKTGHRVAVGWHGGHCGHCESCRRGISSLVATHKYRVLPTTAATLTI